MDGTDRAEFFGRIVVQPGGAVDRPEFPPGWPGLPGPGTFWGWFPPEDVAGELPEGFCLPLCVQVGDDGHRRLSPVGVGRESRPRGWSGGEGLTFIARARAAGFALLSRLPGMTAQHRHTHRVMWFLYQYAQRMRGAYRRKFSTKSDFMGPLEVKKGETHRKSKTVIRSIVPPPEPASDQEYLPLTELADRGRAAAIAAGIARPDAHQSYHHSLLVWARGVTQPVQKAAVPTIIRSALFAYDGRNPVDGRLKEIVYGRICDALALHTDEPADAFNRWFTGRGSSFVRQITQGKKKEGGELTTDEVTSALLELGWDAYTYVAVCISRAMQAVLASLPGPATERERAVFAQMHLPQPHFGGLPLVLLGGRLNFARDLVREVCENPGDRVPVDALLRLLQLYAYLVVERRQQDLVKSRHELTGTGDDRGEERDGQDTRQGRQPAGLDPEDTRRGRQPGDFDLHDLIATRILADKAEGCRCDEPDWRTQSEPDLEEDPITVDVRCKRCKIRRRTHVATSDYLECAGEVVPPPIEDRPPE